MENQPCPRQPRGVQEQSLVDGKSLRKLLAGGVQEDLRSRFPGQRQHYGGLVTPSKEIPEVEGDISRMLLILLLSCLMVYKALYVYKAQGPLVLAALPPSRGGEGLPAEASSQ